MNGVTEKAGSSSLPTRNAFVSIVQVVVTTLVAFATYAYVSREFGIGALGIWSVTLALSTLVSVADLGVGGGLVRFVALLRSKADQDAARLTAITAIVFVAFVTGSAAILCYFPLVSLVGWIVPENERSLALQLLPFALGTIALNTTSETVLGGLEGCERYGLRAIAVVSGNLVLLGMVFAAEARDGAQALGAVFASQSATALCVGLIMLTRALGLHHTRMVAGGHSRLVPLLAMGWRLKVIGLVNLLLEPITKAFVLRFGGSELSGLYEVAARMPAQLRSLLVVAMQVTVPRFAALPVEARRRLHQQLAGLALFIGTASFTMLVLALPLISALLLGDIDSRFIAMSMLMSIGWFLNVQSAPAYFAHYGSGELRWNVAGQVTMGVLNVVLGWLGGMIWGGVGVVMGTATAIGIGSAVTTVAFGVRHHAWPRVGSARDRLALLSCPLIALAAAQLLLRGPLHEHSPGASAIIAMCFAALAAFYMHGHALIAEIRSRSG